MGWLRDSFEAVGRESLLRQAVKEPPMTDEEYVGPHIDTSAAISRGKGELARFTATIVVVGSIVAFASSEVNSSSEAEHPPIQPPPQCPAPGMQHV
ncbi:MAG TPA: hypothetical protein VFX86_01455 [Candidatus Saccharimonadales bacterium]|nr:hypothetical protein [Candidatus Saccharimonadales bacterium]